jgi:amino acid transporter
MMLWFEVVSVTLILLVVVATLWSAGFRLDLAQLHLRNTSGNGIRLGLVLAIFSFVGFESATTLGHEARDPLRTVPRAVILSAVLAGIFFVVCAYTEVLGFAQAHQDLAKSEAPLHFLADRAGLSVVASLIDAGAAISFFACTLSCIIAAARVIFSMAHRGLAPQRLTRVHSKNDTPHVATVIVALVAVAPAIALFARGASGSAVNGWMGTLATYGFLVAYLLVSVALPVHLRKHDHLNWRGWLISVVAVLAMLGTLLGSLYPFPSPPDSYLLFVFAAYMLIGFCWSLLCRRNAA